MTGFPAPPTLVRGDAEPTRLVEPMLGDRRGFDAA